MAVTWCCIIVLTAFGVVVNAQCSDFVEFVVDNKTFNNANTLYKSNNTSGVVRCSRCVRKNQHAIMWDGISSCDDDDMSVPCTKSVGTSKIDQDLVFSTFVTGTYICGGTRNQEMIMIIAIGPPEITDHPTSGDVPMGRSITLMCRASSLGTLVYSWERRSSGSSWTTVSNDNTTSYTTDTALTIGEYMYRCNVSNEAGSVVSNSATVNVYGLPTITTHPTSQLTTVSMSVTLNCEGTGRGSITYQWQTRNINGGQWNDISNSDNRRLIVSNLQKSQQYRCVVSNEAGVTRSDVATVTVLKITIHPSSTNVTALQDITLTCSSSVDDLTYSWHRDGDSVPSRSRGRNSNTLNITRATPPDEGRYYCMANKEGISMESSRARVRVDDQLSISVAPTKSDIVETESAEFTATASGVNKRNFVYQWRKKGSSKLPNKVSGVKGAVLTIPDLVESDEGVYYCTVTNQWGNSVRSDDVSLTVIGPPQITDHPTGGDVPIGRSITLMCRASGLGTLVYSWERRSSGRKWPTVSNDNTTSYTTDTTLTIGEYMYRCNVSNEAGSVVSNSATVNMYGPPTIEIHPGNQTITAGTRIALNCEGTGRGSITYQWQTKNINGGQWSNISNSNNTRLVVRNLQESQKYMCVVSNEAGGTRSNVVTVTVLKITTHPSSTNVTALQNVKLTCSASVDNVTYSWHRDGGSLPSTSRGRSRNTLTIRTTIPPDEGMYYCMATKEGISVKSNRATLTVDDKLQLSINVSPNNRIGEGVTARFTATAKGVNKNQFIYQWKKKNSDDFPEKVFGVNGIVLTIPNLVESDEGVYYCNVTNQWGNSVKSNNVTLTVEAGLPVVWRHPQNQSINNNDKVKFDCFANGSDSLNITWEKDRRSYTSGVIQVISDGITSSLTLNRATVTDSGKYRCRATNSDGQSVTSKEAKLIILPKIITNPNDDIVFTGRSTQLTCKALGTDIVYQWMKDGVVVSGANSNMSRITDIEESDEGVYKCVASNKGGWVESNPATITVYGPPIVVELPQQVHIVLGEEFQITCTATNDQDAPTNLMFSWRTPKGVKFNETTTDEDDSRTASSTLHISSVTSSDNGSKYTCNVRNIRGGGVGTSFTLIVEEKSSRPTSFNITQVLTNSLQLTWSVPTNPHGSINYYNVYYYNSSDQPVQVVHVTNFTGNYTLDNLRPYTEYSVYVTAVRLIGTTGRSLEGEKSNIVSARTLAGEPSLAKVDKNKPELIINENSSASDGTMSDKTFTIDLPAISLENGPFSHLYIIVAVNDSVIKNVEEISTEDLLEKTNEPSLLYYVAAVIYSYQYNSNNAMKYILGAGDNTTDPDGHVFYNRDVQGNYYFFRIFSANSTQENEIFTTTMIESFHISSSDGGGGGGSAVGVVVGVIVALLIFIAIIIAIILFLFYYKKTYLKQNQNDLSQVVLSDSGIQMKEKEMKEEKAKPLPVVNPVALSAQVPSDNLLMEVVTSAGQPTTLFVELPYADESEITWKKDNKPSNYPVLPDGSLYITNTNLNDSGEYNVTASSAESSMSERLHLKVINPQLPFEMSKRKSIKVDDFPEHVAMMRSKKNEQFEADYESMVVNIPFSQHTAKLHVNASKNRYKNIVPYDHSRVVLSLQGHKPGSDYVNASFIDGYKEPKAYIAAQGPVADTVNTFWRMIWEKNVATIVMVTKLVEDAKVKCHQYWPNNTEPATYGDYKVTILKQEEIAKYCIRNFTIEKVTNQKHEVRSVYFTAWPDHGVPSTALLYWSFKKELINITNERPASPCWYRSKVLQINSCYCHTPVLVLVVLVHS